MLELSQDQSNALSHITDWYKDKSKLQYLTLGGYAGTGKTTLISTFRNELKKIDKNAKVAFCAYTGKASRVLALKLKDLNSVFKEDTIGTIHSLIYSPRINAKDEIIGWELKGELDADIIILDEASMVDQVIWQDLRSFGKPILAVGDHGQLAPINGDFNLMENPMIKLTQIHRQAKENPIIQLSIFAREDGRIPPGHYGDFVEKFDRTNSDGQEKLTELLADYNSDALILCGYNTTRINLNKHIRGNLELYTPIPEINDRVICLKNNHAKKIYNGMLGSIKNIEIEDENWHKCEIEMDNEDLTYKGLVYSKQFNNPESFNYTKDRYLLLKGDLFDFGYALTVHKAQGSQAKRVILFEERFKQMTEETWKRWLYTAVTRAEEELFIF